MSLELEGMIARLLMFVACAGEQGCSAIEFLDILISVSCSPEDIYSYKPGITPEFGTSINQEVITIWSWIVERKDISVGPNRKFNHLALNEALALSETNSCTQYAESNAQDGFALSKSSAHCTGNGDLRIYASDETMWEAITGHAMDYKRVPRSEWLLLLGIASTKAQGILQGDLGRLVGQDKRSVPKRTDALVKKGYITKRTTLVRGTKTSKMWLKPFAPPLPRDKGTAIEPEEVLNLSRQILANNLDPVPWHTRWTSESVDYTALATTIMGTCKEWGVMRMQDLKAKLGVLGMRWQMKVVSKVCRFLNARDTIRYVAAKLENKVFKDCIRFNRDLTTKDWSIFLATGKRAGKLSKTSELDGIDGVDQVIGYHTSMSRLSVAPSWSKDQPLPVSIAKAIALDETGLTNPDVYGLTLGGSFTRFLSSMTTSMSTPNIQPAHIKHLQVKSEHSRVGKVASYRFFMSPAESRIPSSFFEGDSTLTGEPSGHMIHSASSYGFTPTSQSLKDNMLAAICSIRLPQRKSRGRPKILRPSISMDSRKINALATVTRGEEAQPQVNTSLIVVLKVSQHALRAVPQGTFASREQTPASHSAVDRRNIKADESEHYVETILSTQLSQGRESGCGRGSRFGRSRRQCTTSGDETLNSRPWRCDKCGGAWKNDIGLKYHLEKSQTACNPFYRPSTTEASRRSKKSALISGNGSFSPERAANVSTQIPGSLNIFLGTGRAGDGASSGQNDLQDDEGEAHHALAPNYTISTLGSSPSSGRFYEEHHVSKLYKPMKLSTSSIGQVALIHATVGQPRKIHPLRNRLYRVNRFRNCYGTDAELAKDLKSADANIAAASSKTSTHAIGDSHLLPSGCAAQHNMGLSVGTRGVQMEARTDCKSSKREDYGAHIENGVRRNVPSYGAANCISAVIMNMLTEQNGVLPGGESLLRVIAAVWGARYPNEPTPKAKDCQLALSRMLKTKLVLEHWHGFQSQTGLFTKCQIITLPYLDAFSAQSLLMVEKIKECYPQPFVPAFFSSLGYEARPQEKRDMRRGRRVLAGEVAVLDAPVYAAQVAAKRRPNISRDATQQLKRRKFIQHARDNSISPITQDEYRIRWAAKTRSPSKHEPEIAHDDQLASHIGLNSKIQFLAPNTFLEDEPPGYQTTKSRTVTVNRLDTALDGDFTQKDLPLDDSSWNVMMVEPIWPILGPNGTWPHLESLHFEGASGASFTMRGWMPDTKWFIWATIVQDIKNRTSESGTRRRSSAIDVNPSYYGFIESLVACLDLELTQAESFVNAPPLVAGPHNIFIRFSTQQDTHPSPSHLAWPPQEQLTLESAGTAIQDIEASISSSDEDFFQLDLRMVDLQRSSNALGTTETSPQSKIKSIPLVARALTTLPTRVADEPKDLKSSLGEGQTGNRAEVMAAFIAVRVLLGGADKAVDWGLLVKLFPKMGLASLRKFWTTVCKEQGPYIKKFTRDFQVRLIEAYEKDELPLIDFEDPLDYDWQRLVRWTMQLSRQKGFQIPKSRKLLDGCFALEGIKALDEDWREKFFHVQSSIFSRFEAVTTDPGAVPIDSLSRVADAELVVTEIGVAKSWIKSLCFTGETKYSVRQIRDRFLKLSKDNSERSAILLKGAIDQLTKQRVICKSRKPPLGGRPYRLSEWYVSMLGKVSQRSKYDDAAAFKAWMDDTFRRQEALEIPYTLNDGSMMALTNLNAAGRIQLVPMDIPNIPFGFEPGNYESRKYPKSYYHFSLQAVPTNTYQYDEDIDVLRVVAREDPPKESVKGEIPQWVDFFGECDSCRWAEILGAFCFAFATRGSLTIEGVCNAVKPVLEGFEAQLIVEWGKKTGVIESAMEDINITMGEWWWLAVPRQYRDQRATQL